MSVAEGGPAANAVKEICFALESKIVRGRDPERRAAHRRPRHAHRAPDHDTPRHSAARARLGLVHARRDPGAGGGHARHLARRAENRRAARRIQGALHASLQHAALCDRRNRTRRLAEAARNRPWPARQACAAGGAADARGIRVFDARRVGDHRIERLELDGVGVRRLSGADGCGRPAQGARRGNRDGTDQGGQPLRRADRHPGRRGSSRRHGFQGRRHRAGHHRAADGHQDHRHHQGDHACRAGAGARRPPAYSRQDEGRAAECRVPNSRPTRRA